MKSPLTKFAAAAILFFAALLGINLIPGSEGPVALAGIIETFKNAACIAYDLKIGDNSPPIRDTVYQNRIHRESLGSTIHIDLELMRMLVLTPQTKQAVSIDLKGLPEDLSNPKFNYVDRLVNLLTELQTKSNVEIEPLQPQVTDEKTLAGVRATCDNVTVIIWFDPQTDLPVKIIEKQPNLEVTLCNFDFNITPDPAMFSMDVPEGYTLMDGQNLIDFKKDATEENFIAFLGMMAEVNDGWFPRDVSIEYIVANAEQIGGLIEKSYEGSLRQMQAGLAMARGLTFLRFFKGQGQWYYGGNGVRLGQAEEPVFWYRPKDSEVFRVIFGDLHVEEVAPADIDALVSMRLEYAKFGYQIADIETPEGRQEDRWYIKPGNIVEVHSLIDITTARMYLPSLDITLPIQNAVLISASVGDNPLPFETTAPLNVRLFPDGRWFAEGQHVITLVWQFSLDDLKTADYGYVVPLQSLIPVTSYKILAILDPDCGYRWNKSETELKKAMKRMPSFDPDNPRILTLFTQGGSAPKTTFGTCGLGIIPE